MKALVKAMAVASNVIVVVILFFIVGEVLFRSIFGKSIKGVVEISGSLMVPMYFLGVSFVQLRNEHIKVDSISKKLPPRLGELQGMLTSIIILTIFSLIGYYGLIIAIRSYQTEEFEFTISFWPIWVIRVFVPLGALLMDLLVITELVTQVRRFIRAF